VGSGDDRSSTAVGVVARPDERAPRRRLVLRVLCDGALSSHPLPAEGTVSLGRSGDVDVCIEHASVSRRHAVLHLGAELRIEDLGSANGTRLRERRLDPNAPAPVAVGEAIDVGAVIVVVQPERALDRPAESPRGSAMERLLGLRDRVAQSNISVLLLGETGAGKEVMAESIHRQSPRRNAPFLRLNCAALSETLLESELFGHEKGAFTGAVAPKPGLLETAHDGTVLLDEVGELPAALQVKLLRVLEERQVLRVGGLKPRPIDVRFISATNRDLQAESEEGKFRRDLYFRLNGITLVVPPLRERIGEIATLARDLVQAACRQSGRAQAPSFSPEALARLERYGWPGNVRELRNVVERAVLLCTGDVITPEHLPGIHGSAARTPLPGIDAPRAETLREELGALERKRILDTLAECGGNQTRAAKRLGMRRQSLVARLDEYGIPRPRKR
jgi:DNA-binding NtrC family response regulator